MDYDKHIEFMKIALKEANKAKELGEVPVGAIIVLDDKIIGKGYNLRENQKNSLYHAEIIAINQACRNIESWRLVNSTIYVTLEPCPMCAGAIINSRIQNVVFGASDYKAGSCGSVINLFELNYNHKPNIVSGILKNECSEILSDFFKKLRKLKKQFD